MATRRIRLTESELTNLIRRIVEDTENVDNMGMEPMMDEPKREGKGMSWIMSAAREVADMFKSEVLPNLSDEEVKGLERMASRFDAKDALRNLKMYVNTEEGEEALSKAEEMMDDSLVMTEGVLTEGISNRVIKALSRLGVFAGLGMLGGGFMAFVSEIPGYIDSEFLTAVNQMVEDKYGCGNFCGPLSVLVMILGIAMALGSRAMRYRRTGGGLPI
jgi:hypothetical protein